MKTPVEITRLRGGALAVHSAGRRIATVCTTADCGQDAESGARNARIIQAAFEAAQDELHAPAAAFRNETPGA